LPCIPPAALNNFPRPLNPYCLLTIMQKNPSIIVIAIKKISTIIPIILFFLCKSTKPTIINKRISIAIIMGATTKDTL
jgi:hypothetical protein